MMRPRTLADELRDGVEALALHVSEIQQAQLLDYLALLQKWGRVYNLTAVRDPKEMLTHHLLDCLALVGPLRRALDDAPAGTRRVLDVGAGAGLPGVVIAVCCPDVEVHCVDTVAKKAAFVQQVAGQLRLPRLQGVHARVESITGTYDIVVSRAFASLPDFVAWSHGALAPGGVWLAMKGKHPAEEIAALPPEIEVFHVEPLEVPGLTAQRCLVWMRRRAGASPA